MFQDDLLKVRATTNKIKGEPGEGRVLAMEKKQVGEGSAELLPEESHATASLISRCCLPQL